MAFRERNIGHSPSAQHHDYRADVPKCSKHVSGLHTVNIEEDISLLKYTEHCVIMNTSHANVAAYIHDLCNYYKDLQ